MRAIALLLCGITAFAGRASAQTPTPSAAPPLLELDGTQQLLELDGTQQRPVLLSSQKAIHAADDPVPAGLTPIQRAMQTRERIFDGMVSVELSVVLDSNGLVESAKAIRGPERFYEQAVELEKERAFEPILNKDGVAVRAHFTDYVAVHPPERWLDHPPAFPQQVDLSTFRISLERTGCFGSCPSYKVSVAGSGDVLWEGSAYLAVPGTHHAKLSLGAVRNLLDQVRASRLSAALDEYRAGWTDNPTYTVTLDVNGRHKTVIDYIGPIVGMPTSISDLEETIDRVAGTEKWIKGTPDLLPALAAEHWNFAAPTSDNVQLYDSAVKSGNRELLRAFSAARGPVFTDDPKIESPACVASGLADSHLALEMLSTVPKDRKLPQRALDGCLVSAARGGNLELVDLWLKREASLTPAPPPDSGGEYIPDISHPLTAAVQGGSPDVVQRLLEAHAPLDPEHNGKRNLVTFAVDYCRARDPEDKKLIIAMLLKAGADPNRETDIDRPALFALNDDAEIVPLLVAEGAQINRRDSEGNTALAHTVYVKTLRALLDAGADPTLHNREGQTAGERFRAEGLKEQADLLDAAARAKLGLAAAQPLPSAPPPPR